MKFIIILIIMKITLNQFLKQKQKLINKFKLNTKQLLKNKNKSKKKMNKLNKLKAFSQPSAFELINFASIYIYIYMSTVIKAKLIQKIRYINLYLEKHRKENSKRSKN